jgi:C4-dicarboxylate-specific signal transduction histidine kinase
MKYTKKFKEILAKLDKIDANEGEILKNEIQQLAEIYTKKESRLEKIIKLSDKQQKAILELNEELDEYKSNLERKVEEEILKRQEQEELLLEQNRLAALSEMINSVAHQWVQPINIIWMDTELLTIQAKKKNGLSVEDIEIFEKKSYKQINHLMETLNNFRNFFQPAKALRTFMVDRAIESVLNLVHNELQKYTITVEFNREDTFSLLGNENEFKHIFINLINNSKDTFIENDIKERKITIKLFSKEKKIEFIDNAGGIDEKILPSLFKMHSSTKGEHGTGLGLYMSQQIAHKHNGYLVAENFAQGAKFTFIYRGENNGLI